MAYKSKKVKLGIVGVDSGQLILCDPSYLHDWKKKEFNPNGKDTGEFSYNGVCHKTLKTDYKENQGQINFDKGHAGRAVVFSPGIGDGLYEVVATVKDLPIWGRRITKVEIIFMEEESETIIQRRLSARPKRTRQRRTD